MKRAAKILCVILSLIMLFCTIPVFAYDESDIPVVYIKGRYSPIYTNVDTPEEKQVFPVVIPDGYLQKQLLKIAPKFAKGIMTSDYAEFGEMFYEAMVPLYEGLALDENGDPMYNSGIKKDENKVVPGDGKYGIYDYSFGYDWRLDPMKNADTLNDYIKEVKAATGAKKVSIVFRCMATTLGMAYLTKYGTADVDTAILYNPSCNGIDLMGELYCGNFEMHPDAIERFACEELGADAMFEFLKSGISMLNAIGLLDLISVDFTNNYHEIKDGFLSKLVTSTYGSLPGFWSMVGDDYYAEAKANIYKDNEDTYKGIISKIDNYHYNVGANIEQTLQKCTDEGMKLAIVTKYGYQQVPLTSSYEKEGDMAITLEKQSFGATCAPHGKALTEEYVSSVIANGNGKYLSKNNAVDASTAAFRDITWFASNLNHADYPDCFNELFMEIINSEDQLTVFESKNFPQFIRYDRAADVLVPDETEIKEETKSSFLSVLLHLHKSFVSMVTELFKKLIPAA